MYLHVVVLWPVPTDFDLLLRSESKFVEHLECPFLLLLQWNLRDYQRIHAMFLDQFLNDRVLVASGVEDADIFTNFITKEMALIFHRSIGQKQNAGTVVDEESGLVSYSETRLTQASNIIALMVSSVVPVLTIFALNSVKTTNARVGLTVLFTAVFSTLLAMFSNAKGVEIFSATTA